VTNIARTRATDGAPTYLGKGDPAARVLRERLAGTPYADHFLAGEA
jgi:hypothetical protein